MFGYVAANLHDLSEAEQRRYRAAYCGLCHALHERFGNLSRFSLTYDMTFLTLLLGSLYEPEERAGQMRCVLHPAKPHQYVRTQFSDYAADLSVVLAYHKCLDDWHDDRNPAARGYAALLAQSYRAVATRLGRQCAAIEGGLADIARIEEAGRAEMRAATGTRAATGASASASSVGTSTDAPSDAFSTGASPDAPADASAAGASAAGASAETSPDAPPEGALAPSPDAAANRFGALLGELFVYQDDVWADALRQLGDQLGRFVYFMDAACDLERDRRKGSYNPLAALNVSQETVGETLSLLAARATKVFEKLPLERDLHLLRSVLYSGMWQKYRAHLKREEKTARPAKFSTVKES